MLPSLLLAMSFPLQRVLTAATGSSRLWLSTSSSPSTAAAAAAARSAVVVMSSARPKRHLVELADKYYAEIDEAAFSNFLLPHDVQVRWNPRLRRTAGRCLFLTLRSPTNTTRRAEIELSPRVLTTPERLRSTLAHEMCHAMQWLVDAQARPPHGPAFHHWAAVLEARCPEIRDVSQRCHTYEVATRYNYKCEACSQKYGRHSRLDVNARRCGVCGGTLKLDHEKLQQQPKGSHGGEGCQEERLAPVPAFATFVADNYAGLRAKWPHVTHQRIMQTLGRQWRRLPKQERVVFAARGAARSQQKSQGAAAAGRRSVK